MKILNLTTIRKQPKPVIDELFILSLCQSLYTVRLRQKDNYFRVKYRFKAYQAYSIAQIHEDFKDCDIRKITLVQDSPYDEMIGQAPRSESNTLTVSSTAPFN